MFRKYIRVFANFLISSMFLLLLTAIISTGTVAVSAFGVPFTVVMSAFVLFLAFALLLFMIACGCLQFYDGVVSELTEDGSEKKEADVEAYLITGFLAIMSLIALGLIPVITLVLFKGVF